METITLEVNFKDLLMLKATGLKVPQPAAIQCLATAVPQKGDIVTFAELSYPGGERARWLVDTKAHLIGGLELHRIQINVSLYVAHQP